MNSEERKLIKDLKKCDFKEMHQYFTEVHSNAQCIIWQAKAIYTFTPKTKEMKGYSEPFFLPELAH